MFDHIDGCSLLLVTANSYVNQRGALVMGRGAAAEALKRFPGCAKRFGPLVKQNPGYGLIFDPNYPDPRLGIFRVKEHWADPAEDMIIYWSIKELSNLAASSDWKTVEIFLNFPGIGWGRRRDTEILPLLKPLPDNVVIWRYT